MQKLVNRRACVIVVIVNYYLLLVFERSIFNCVELKKFNYFVVICVADICKCPKCLVSK